LAEHVELPHVEHLQLEVGKPQVGEEVNRVAVLQRQQALVVVVVAVWEGCDAIKAQSILNHGERTL
jgi:hypothetical protein